MSKRHEQTFLQRHPDSQEMHEKMLVSLTIRDTQIKTTTKDHLTPVRMTKSKTQKPTSAGEDVKKTESSCTVGGNANWCSHCGKQHGDSSKSEK